MSDEPRPYDLSKKSELRRLVREVHGYLYLCNECGTDYEGRQYALEALRALGDELNKDKEVEK